MGKKPRAKGPDTRGYSTSSTPVAANASSSTPNPVSVATHSSSSIASKPEAGLRGKRDSLLFIIYFFSEESSHYSHYSSRDGPPFLCLPVMFNTVFFSLVFYYAVGVFFVFVDFQVVSVCCLL